MGRAILYSAAIAVALAGSAAVARCVTQAPRRPLRCPCTSPACCSVKCAGCCLPLPCVLGGEKAQVELCRHAERK